MGPKSAYFRHALVMVVSVLVGFGCAQPDESPMADSDGMPAAMDHTEHARASEDLEPAEPAVPGMSLYQLESRWTNQNAESVQLASLAGKVQVVAMTYTSCEVSCPVIVADMKRIEASIVDAGVEVGFVLLSLDPDRDTPEKLASYAQDRGLSSRWTLLTAPPDDVLEMSMLLGVRYRRLEDGEFAHSNLLSVLDATGVPVHQQNGLGPDLARATIAFLTGL